MPLDSSRLKTAIKDAILAADIGAVETDPVTGNPSTVFDKACEAIADAIITEITTNLTVVIPIGQVIVSATGGVLNVATISCNAS